MSDVLLVLVPALVLFLVTWLGFRRPRWWISVLLAIGAVLVALSVVWKLSSVRAGVLGPTVLRFETTEPVVALTLDDGPTVAYTKPVLDLLEEAGAHATFFLVGRELEAHPELGEAILAGGHELGNHSWTHPRLVFASRASLEAEVAKTDALLRDVGATGPIPFRPPYGKRLLGLHAVLGARPAVLWDVEPESDRVLAEDPVGMARHVVEQARPGSVILLHAMYESREPTRLALPAILRGLSEKGLRVTTLRELRELGAR
ncbi:MAG: polysaccharide deacetylase family protein [Myxococcota bacterium]